MTLSINLQSSSSSSSPPFLSSSPSTSSPTPPFRTGAARVPGQSVGLHCDLHVRCPVHLQSSRQGWNGRGTRVSLPEGGKRAEPSIAKHAHHWEVGDDDDDDDSDCDDDDDDSDCDDDDDDYSVVIVMMIVIVMMMMMMMMMMMVW